MSGIGQRSWTCRIENVLRFRYGRWSSALALLVMAAVACKTASAVHLRLFARRWGSLKDVTDALTRLLPAGWVETVRVDKHGNDIEPADACRLLVRLRHHTVPSAIESRQVERSSLATAPGEEFPEPMEGWLNVALDEGHEHMRWRANRAHRQHTPAGRARDQRVDRAIDLIRRRLEQLDVGADVLFDGRFDLPDVAIVPQHMPELIYTVHSLARARAIIDIAPAPNGGITASTDLLRKVAGLLMRAGAIDQPPDLARDDLDFLAWFDCLSSGRGAMSMKEILEGFASPAFRDEVQSLLMGTGIRLYPANEKWTYHKAYRPLRRLHEVGAVECDDHNREHLWSVATGFRGYRPGNILAQLARS